MQEQLQPSSDAEGEAVELEIQELTERLAKEPAPVRTTIARISRKTTRRILDSWPLAFASLATLGVMTFFNLTGDGPIGYHPPTPSAAEQLSNARKLAQFAAIEGGRFLREYRRLPSSPKDIGLSANDDVSFSTTDETSVVAVARVDGFEASFNSRNAPGAKRKSP